jgi:protein-L-isoaspartate(D-aspartate) O-methyltransferase
MGKAIDLSAGRGAIMYIRGLRLLFAWVAIVFVAESSRLPADGRTTLSLASVANKLHPMLPSGVKATPVAPENEHSAKTRRSMVENLRRQGVRDEQVLAALGQIQRQRFVSAGRQDQAYSNVALQIGHGQTISSPYIVALMTELVQPSLKKRALDIGTGSGYQAAVLARLCKQVYSIEIVEPLANEARKRLAALGYTNVIVRCGDGYRGWPESAPFDIIVVAAAPDHVPQALVDQLAPGGRLVIPVGESSQELLLIEKDMRGLVRHREVLPVKFVPMTGQAQKGRKIHS